MLTVTVNNKIMEFNQQPDGWYTNTDANLAISPNHTICVADPWYADWICEAPTYPFEVIS